MGDGVGQTLREARSERGIELAEVAAVTKVRVEYLRAIEAEEWERLPGDAYARAFIRAYASHLGLDGDELAERQRRGRGVARTVDELPQVELRQLGAAAGRGLGARSVPRVALAGIGAVLVAVLVAMLVLSGGDGGSSPTGGGAPPPAGASNPSQTPAERPVPASPRSHTVSLTATAEVWVCLLDARGEPLIDGQILDPGASEGPYRSGNFTLSLGNGEVTMTVDGEQASIPATPSPVGYSIEGGTMRPISAGERPTCT